MRGLRGIKHNLVVSIREYPSVERVYAQSPHLKETDRIEFRHRRSNLPREGETASSSLFEHG
jgi:hypothetical protein